MRVRASAIFFCCTSRIVRPLMAAIDVGSTSNAR
jgi:hypothetical protein